MPEAVRPFSIAFDLLFVSARDVLIDFGYVVNLRDRECVLLEVLGFLGVEDSVVGEAVAVSCRPQVFKCEAVNV
jgi:hypothetical protein